MCGRFVLTTPADALAAEFAADTGGLLLRPRYNIAPTQEIVVVRNVGGRRTLSMLRWGLIPFWAKDPSISTKLLNARAESCCEKPSYRDAVRKRRAIVPASGFYEWKKEGARKQPWYFRSATPQASLAIAALWESWKSPEGEIVESCCLLTTSANSVLAPVHDRMPVILDPDGVDRWLDPSQTDSKLFADLFVPTPAPLEAWPVSTGVNAVRNDDARNIEPIEAAQPAAPQQADPAQRGFSF
jgi:putative SOS response-associated peptidase YedK